MHAIYKQFLAFCPSLSPVVPGGTQRTDLGCVYTVVSCAAHTNNSTPADIDADAAADLNADRAAYSDLNTAAYSDTDPTADRNTAANDATGYCC